MKKIIHTIILTFTAFFGFSQIDVISTDSIRLEEVEPGTGTSGGPLRTGGPDTTNKVGSKLVYWIHGLSGNQHSWNRVQAVTEDQTGTFVPGYSERDVEGLAYSYSGHENLDIFQLGGFTNNEIEQWRVSIPRRDTLEIRKNFIIAHSQGGLVSRAMRYKNLQDSANFHWQFGALATFGSPHGGAEVINSSRNGGAIRSWLNSGCTILGAAEIETFVGSKWWLDGIISSSAIHDFSSRSCDKLNKTALTILVNSFRKPVTADYAIGARNLSKLDSMAFLDTMPVVTFYSIEKEPVLWRTIHSLTYSTDTSLSGNILTTDPFGLNNDQELPTKINNNIADYISQKNKWNTIARNRNIATIIPFLGVVFIYGSHGASEKAVVFDRAAHWLGTANGNWKRFIGARRDTSYQDGYHCECLVDLGGTSGYDFQYFHVQTFQDCENIPALRRVIKPKIVNTLIDEENDGVVTVSSQTAYPNSIKVKMVETNHMQQRNSIETRDKLNELFEGRHGSEFKLDKK